MVGQIYPTELQLIKANSFDKEAQFFMWTCLVQKALFHVKYMINGMISIVK